MSISKKKNLLIIAYAADYPTKDRPTAGLFIKEFVDHLGQSYNCKLMLVKRKFIGIGMRSQINYFLNTLKKLFNRALLEKTGRNPGSFKSSEESVLPVNYPVFTIHGKPLHIFNGLSSVWSARRVLAESGFKPDLIQTFKSFPPAYIGWKLKQKYQVPVVNMEYQGPFSSYAEEPYCMKRALSAIGNIDRTIYTKFQTGVIRSYGIPADRLGHGHFGINTDRFGFDEQTYLKRKSEITKKRAKLLVIGRVDEEKGFKYLINSTSILVKEYPEIQLSIVGPKGNCFEWAMNKIKLLHIEKNVRYLGVVQRDDLPKVINEHDILVIASLIETLGLTMLEAFSCGKPVVATRCGGPEEFINENIGILVPVRDSSALAHGIRQAIRNYHNYDPKVIREYALKNYGYGVVTKRFQRLYDELLLRT